MQVPFTVNGREVTVDAPPNTFLVHAIREHLHLTGTHVGCDTAQCGACTVHVDGRAIKSCNVLVAQVAGAEAQRHAVEHGAHFAAPRITLEACCTAATMLT